MSDETNSRADAKLKRLAVEIHCEIVERLAAMGVTQLDVLGWLKKYHSVDCSPATFSRSLPFIRQRVKSHGREQVILAKMAERKSKEPKLTDEELFAFGQREFAELTIADEDPKGWALIQRTARDKETAALDRVKFQRETCELFVKWFADKQAAKIASSSASNADKIEKLGELMFGEDWK
jgi:hypothetical protein